MGKIDDLYIASSYLEHYRHAKKRSIEFSLSFLSFKNIMRAKKCGYTGIPLTVARRGEAEKPSDRTIDRINNSIGYESGNVIAVCRCANSLKAMWENPTYPISIPVYAQG